MELLKGSHAYNSKLELAVWNCRVRLGDLTKIGMVRRNMPDVRSIYSGDRDTVSLSQFL